MAKKEIYFEASYNPNKKCILVDGDGAAEIKFTTDATQLASVLSSLAEFKESRIGITLKKLVRNSYATRTNRAKTYR